jgi:hypothetical protein
VIYDDPATASCLCCGDYDADCEPIYPRGDFQDVDSRDNRDDGVDDDSNMQRVTCEPIPRQFCRSCDDDECVDQNVTCATLANIINAPLIDFAKGARNSVEVLPDDNEDAAEDNSRVRDSSDTLPDGIDITHEKVWCGQTTSR